MRYALACLFCMSIGFAQDVVIQTPEDTDESEVVVTESPQTQSKKGCGCADTKPK